MTIILGINSAFHESSASIIRDGEILTAIEEERLTGIKHAKKASPYASWILPFNAMNWCLKMAGLTLPEIDHIAYSFKPRLLLSEAKKDKCFSKEWCLFHLNKQIPKFLVEEAPINTEILKRFAILKPRYKFHFVEHHLAHAASSFFVSPFNEAFILSIDGIGEKTCTLMAIGRDTNIKKIKEIHYPNSLGFFYEEITKFLGFQRNNDEYKVMALAAHGKPKYYEALKKMVVTEPKGEYEIRIDFHCPSIMGIKELCDVLGPPRLWCAPITERHTNIAASAQRVLEDTVLHILDWLYKKTKTENLCLAGGVALNCVMNERIKSDSPFKNIFIQPAAHDAGTALGAALWAYNTILKHPRKFIMEHVYLGPEFNDVKIKRKLDFAKIHYCKSNDIAFDCAKLIANGKIIGWFQGQMEFGPRALGNRSILADPRDPDMKNKINKIKGREEFRPLAPSILEEAVGEYFECSEPSPFMLFARKMKLSKQKEIPAVVHIDGTARLQTVNKKQNPLFYRLIKEFSQITGIPLVVNTSLNYQGKPMVCTIEQAIECFYNIGLDNLALGSYLISKDR